MNTDAMHRLADLMEVIEPEAFDMGVWWVSDNDTSVCGTAGCVAGWAVWSNAETAAEAVNWAVTPKEERMKLLRRYGRNLGFIIRSLYADASYPYPFAAEMLLGLTREEGSRLFEGDFWWGEKLEELGLLTEDDEYCFDGITVKQAAVVVRALANGEIDFSFEVDA